MFLDELEQSIRRNPLVWAAGAAALYFVWSKGLLQPLPPDAGGDAMTDPDTEEIEGMDANAWWRAQVDMGQFPVVHRERADGCDQRLLAFLDWWEGAGPFRICVCPSGGLRTDGVLQASFASSGTSNASTLAQTPHGRGGAVDLAPYASFSPQYSDDEGNSPGKWAGAFQYIGQSAESFGLTWGGRFSSYDGPHVEVSNWRSLPYPPRAITS